MKVAMQEKEAVVEQLNVKLIELRDEQQAKRIAQRDRRIEHQTAEEMNREYNKLLEKLQRAKDTMESMKKGGEGFIAMAVYTQQTEELLRSRDELKYERSRTAGMQKAYYDEKYERERKEKDLLNVKDILEDQKRLNTSDREADRERDLKIQEQQYIIDDLKGKLSELRIDFKKRQEYHDIKVSDLHVKAITEYNERCQAEKEKYELELEAEDVKWFKEENDRLLMM